MSTDHINLENVIIDNLTKDDTEKCEAFVNLADLKKMVNYQVILF